MYEWAELRHFRYLLTILERQGFRAAAEELRTAQPNLSVQARQFQENASVRLFRKMKGGRIRPTDTGVAFKVLAKFLLETRDEVLDALIAIERGDVRSVRFGWPALAALTVTSIAHAQGTMDFSGATTLMTTFKTFAIYAGAVICFGGLIFAGIRMMSGRFQDAIPGLFGALFGAGVLGWGAGWIGSLTGQSM